MALLTFVSQTSEAIAQTAICAQHPETKRDSVVRARIAGRGIREQRLIDLTVKSVPDIGGGDCPSERTPRGKAAAAVGALLYNGGFHCSAVLVARTMAVTAAHCIKDFDSTKMEFVLGSDALKPVQRAPVYKAEVHRAYEDSRLGVNDLGYVYLDRTMTEATPVQFSNESLAGTGTNVSLLYVGYGIHGALPGARRCVSIPIRDTCPDSFSSANERMNMCHGDSGGGVFRDINNELSLVGVTSWGDEPCEKFGVSADVGYHNNWVTTQVTHAPRSRPPGPLDESAREFINIMAHDLLAEVQRQPHLSTRLFESKFQGKWVNWQGKVTQVQPQGNDDYQGSCTVQATGTGATLLLLHFPGGCALENGRSLRFTGRLAGLLSGNVIQIELPEPTGVTCPVVDAGSLDVDLRAGLELFRAGKLSEAIPRLEAAVAKTRLRQSEKVCGYLRLAQAHERIARQESQAAVTAVCNALRIDPEITSPAGLEDLFARARTECKVSEPSRLQLAVAIAVALKKIPDRDRNPQVLWAPIAFVGVEPFSSRRRARFAIGVAFGAGLAQETSNGLVVGLAARVDLRSRVGLIAGHGVRLPPDDIVFRHAWGVGLTVRLWSLRPNWE